ncbi:MAG: putative lyase [Planctomycetes bacterium ADurb.Bin126]|nr:MAG: putative lyase [Planctomycetes bacterium ADurb.Bin126]HQL74374.1 HEAT repeat domain-containing protein [Phycisphaerae bacterium]
MGWLSRALAMVLATALGPAATRAQVSAPALSVAQQTELKNSVGQLADPTRSPKTKLEAAELLLTRTYPQARHALAEFLSNPANPSAQVAVAEAIARFGGQDYVEFVEPLMAMLKGKEEPARAAAARALATYKTPAVTEKMVALATDTKLDRTIRLVTISALWQVLDKNTVDALVRLLNDRDESIRNASAEALAKLTNISAFRTNRALAKQWWARNRHKDHSQWLSDLADSLARANSALELENAQLRDRLARSVSELYTATPADQRGLMLLGLLKDPMVDVRRVGASLAMSRLQAGESLSADIHAQARTMLADADPMIRKDAALLLAAMGDGETLGDLLGRLKVETVPAVREGLLAAVGQLRDPKSLPAVLEQVASSDDSVAAAAAMALSRVAAPKALSESQNRKAADAVLARYKQIEPQGDSTTLRESLMAAMGAVRHKDFRPILQTALSDQAATVRLAAVSALVLFAEAEDASLIASLTNDVDRGVRRAAIAAVGALGGQKHLQAILQQTDPVVESDEGVRKQAWDVAMAILSKADTKVLAGVAASLAERTDAGVYRIRVLQLLVDALKVAKSDQLPAALRQLGQALAKASRPAEAAPVCAEAYALLLGQKDPQATAVWLEWVDALVAADDPAVVKAMLEQDDAKAYETVLDRFCAHLNALLDGGKYAPAIVLAEEATRQLGARLDPSRQQALAKVLNQARARQLKADRERVALLAPQVMVGDETARLAAAGEIQAMGERALVPLLEELQRIVSADKPNPEGEKALLSILTQIAPRLTGYDPAAGQDERLKTIQAWMKN